MYTSSYAVVDGLRIRYIRSGSSGTLVIFIHGLGGRAEAWIHQIKTISRRRIAVALDLRGFGESERPPTTPSIEDLARDVLGLMDWLEADKAVIVGASMGGMVAMKLYEINNSRVKALVLSNTGTRVKTNIDTLKKALIDRDPVASKKIAERLGVSHTSLLRILSGSPHYILKVASKLNNVDLSHIPPRITVPTLLIGGSLDKVTPPNTMENLHKTIRNSTIEIIQGAGHLTHIQHPREYTTILERFLDNIGV